MQAKGLLQKLSARALVGIHASRRGALWSAVEALLNGQRLWLTALGRDLGGDAKERHRIKRIDRLLGNQHLKVERRQWYRWLGRCLVGGTRHPVIVVDWCDLDERKGLYLLRAAVAVGGRALPIYEEVHERYGDARLHRRFLHHLGEVLGPQCRPIVLSDAGFRVWWFKLVQERGWHYVGRVRNSELVLCREGGEWIPNSELREGASARAKKLGMWKLSKRYRLATTFYLYKGKAKGRAKHTTSGTRSRSGHSEKQARTAREPWLLVSNLEERSTTAKRVVALYRLRMQIEEGFRDLKSPRHGFALRHNMGRNPQRVANLLLLGALAMLTTWLMGLHAERHGLHRDLQANTEQRRRTLSVFFVGRRLLARGTKFSARDARLALLSLRQNLAAQLPS